MSSIDSLIATQKNNFYNSCDSVSLNTVSFTNLTCLSDFNSSNQENINSHDTSANKDKDSYLKRSYDTLNVDFFDSRKVRDSTNSLNLEISPDKNQVEFDRKILLITDAWYPQVNGVVRALDNTKKTLEANGAEFKVLSPNDYINFPCPFYSEIRLSVTLFSSKIKNTIESFNPDNIHIATEGPIGRAARSYCIKNDLKFSTSFHTLFPDYLKKLCGIPTKITWEILRTFHSSGEVTMVPSPSIKEQLQAVGFKNVIVWSRGIDQEQFYPRDRDYANEDRPISMYVGRLSKEKNIEAFLELDLPGTKYVVGDGPIRKKLEKKYKDVKFLGYKHGDELAKAYSNADVFVFPSKTDTFGNVILEALACGTPVAAFPVSGPKDIIVNEKLGVINDNLKVAISRALEVTSREECTKYAKTFTWEYWSNIFIKNLVSKK